MQQLLNALIAVSAISITACAFDGPDDPDIATDQAIPVAPNTEAAESFDDDLARKIAKAKGDVGRLVDDPQASPSFAPCGRTAPNLGDERVNDAPASGAAQQRSGSSTTCIAPGALQPTDDAVYYCYTNASDGSWTYLKNLRTGVVGWTRDDLLKPPRGAFIGGSSVFCGF